jgi:hypothetical protein
MDAPVAGTSRTDKPETGTSTPGLFQTSASGRMFQTDAPVAEVLVGARLGARTCPMDLYRALIPVACLPVGPSATVKDTF